MHTTKFFTLLFWLFINHLMWGQSAPLVAQDKYDYQWPLGYTPFRNRPGGILFDFTQGDLQVDSFFAKADLAQNASICDPTTGKLLLYTGMAVPCIIIRIDSFKAATL